MNPLLAWKEVMREQFRLEVRRLNSRPSQKLRDAVRQARKDKVVNKTRERELARHGVWNSRVLMRMRQGPPAHVLSHMSVTERDMDKTSRMPGSSVS